MLNQTLVEKSIEKNHQWARLGLCCSVRIFVYRITIMQSISLRYDVDRHIMDSEKLSLDSETLVTRSPTLTMSAFWQELPYAIVSERPRTRKPSKSLTHKRRTQAYPVFALRHSSTFSFTTEDERLHL